MNYSLAKKKRVDSDNVASTVLKVVAALSIVAIALILFFIAGNSVDAIFEIGLFEFVFGSEWDPSTGLYGALPVIVGTILVTIGAVAVALPVGLACAVYISEVAKPKYRNILKTLCEVFAGIPSVIYGFFGLVVMVPLLREMFPDQLAYRFVASGTNGTSHDYLCIGRCNPCGSRIIQGSIFGYGCIQVGDHDKSDNSCSNLRNLISSNHGCRKSNRRNHGSDDGHR